MVAQVSAVQGNAISFSKWERNVSQATWLAKYLLSQVEYKARFYDIKDVEIDLTAESFAEEICPKDPNFGCDFTYNLLIEEWKLPLLDLALGKVGGDDDSGAEGGGGFLQMAKEQLKKFLGDEILKIAHVEVFWPEGARLDSVEIAYLITAQGKLDAAIEGLKPPRVEGEAEKCPKDRCTGQSGQCRKPRPGERIKDGKCVGNKARSGVPR